jgi:hypothetical protein
VILVVCPAEGALKVAFGGVAARAKVVRVTTASNTNPRIPCRTINEDLPIGRTDYLV